MKWRARAAPSRAKERANISFFIFIMFFAVFGVIVLTELLLLERPNVPGSARSRYSENLQVSLCSFIAMIPWDNGNNSAETEANIYKILEKLYFRQILTQKLLVDNWNRCFEGQFSLQNMLYSRDVLVNEYS